MKKISSPFSLPKFVWSFMATLVAVLGWAQEKSAKLEVDVNMNKATDVTSGNWMQNPLVWVIGALVLIILIALVSRGRK